MFHTIFYQLKDPKNIGMIIRSHVAFNGQKVIFAGYNPPYSFKKKEKAFSRSLFQQCDKLHFKLSGDMFCWAKENTIKTIAVEITPEAEIISKFDFSQEVALIFGNESHGLPEEVLKQCDHVVRIPQFGGVGSLNVAISASIVMYEINRTRTDLKKVNGRMYHFR
ncbi:MAG: TrmH family RNA methyltransferase [Bacteroidota bacterium]|nr:TrmH family RNA methyltransferase [Bacteroidota bacterium]